MKRLAGLSLLLLAHLPAYGADTLVIDPSHTAIIFSWSHRGFSHPVARLEKVEGSVILDRADPAKSSVSVTMPLEGLRTGDDYLDKRLKTAEFLDLAKYPALTFKSTRVKRLVGKKFKLYGDLAVHGVTMPVVLDARINRIRTDPAATSTSAGFEADVVLRRSDFGVSKYVPTVGDALTVHITLEANEAG